MAYRIEEATGRLLVEETPVFATMSGGVLDCIVRCPNAATFDAIAESVGMLSRQTDEEGIEQLVPGKDVNISRMGPVVLTPGVYDEDGNEVTPPVMDMRYHVNYRLGPAALASGAWESWIVQWMQFGTIPDVFNKAENAISLFAVELIDPLTINSPKRVWL